jgi:peptidoglycan/LPS O-acetylase OafA/YrhL
MGLWMAHFRKMHRERNQKIEVFGGGNSGESLGARTSVVSRIFNHYAVLILGCAAIMAKKKKRPIDDLTKPKLASSSWKPVFYSIPTTLILWIGYCWLGGDPSLDFRNSFIPLPFKFLHHAVYFVVGACLYRIKCLERFRRFSLVYLLFSLPAFVCRAWLQIKDLTGPLNPLASLLLSAADALGMWLTIFGLIGLSQKFFNRSSSTLSYLADSSYWIYLCHLPIVGMIQVLLLGYSWASGVKFSLVTAIVLTTGYWTYKSMIRNSFIGGWLHGSRQTSAFAMIPSRQGGIEETIKSIPR